MHGSISGDHFAPILTDAGIGFVEGNADSCCPTADRIYFSAPGRRAAPEPSACAACSAERCWTSAAISKPPATSYRVSNQLFFKLKSVLSLDRNRRAWWPASESFPPELRARPRFPLSGRRSSPAEWAALQCDAEHMKVMAVGVSLRKALMPYFIKSTSLRKPLART